jgi:hypothetical protein
MPVISTFAALSARGYGVGTGSAIFGGGGWIGYETTGTVLDSFVDASGNTYYLFNISNTATALVKTNYLGTVTFYKSIPAYLVTIEVVSSIIYLGGSTTGASGGSAYIMKLTSSGSLTWARTLAGLPSGSVVRKIDIDGSSNVFGYVSLASGADGGYVILDSAGTGTNTVTYTQTGAGTNVLKGYRNSSGNIWAMYGPSLISKAPPGGTGRGVTCRNSAGTLIFNYEPNVGLGTTNVTDFVVDSSNNTYIAVTGADNVAKIAYLVLIKLDFTGTVQWSVAKGYGYAGALVTPLGTVKLTTDNGSLFVSYSYLYATTNASFVEAISTTTGAQIFSNYLRVNGNYATIAGLDYSSSNQQLIVSTTNDIFNLPTSGRVPTPGTYANGARSYIYYPTFDPGYVSVGISTNSQTSGSSSSGLVATTITPTITDIGSALSVISIGSGL